MQTLNVRTTASFSNEFAKLLIAAGLRQPKQSSKPPSASRHRNVEPLSFHSLRHTTTSLLKNARVSDVVARDIIGHESPEVSLPYTHIDAETTRRAVDQFPDFTE